MIVIPWKYLVEAHSFVFFGFFLISIFLIVNLYMAKKNKHIGENVHLTYKKWLTTINQNIFSRKRHF